MNSATTLNQTNNAIQKQTEQFPRAQNNQTSFNKKTGVKIASIQKQDNQSLLLTQNLSSINQPWTQTNYDKIIQNSNSPQQNQPIIISQFQQNQQKLNQSWISHKPIGQSTQHKQQHQYHKPSSFIVQNLHKQISTLSQQKQIYKQKYESYKNMVEKQQQIIQNLRNQKKQLKQLIANYQLSIRGKLEGEVKVKDMEILRYQEELREKQEQIKALEKRVQLRAHLSRITIQEVDQDKQQYIADLQQLLKAQQQILVTKNKDYNNVKQQNIQLLNTNIIYQEQINQLSIQIQQLNAKIKQINSQKQKQTRKFKKLMQNQQNKIRELGKQIINLVKKQKQKQKQSQMYCEQDQQN